MLTVRQRYRRTDRQTDGWTDGPTTYDSNTALALRASRGKNIVQQLELWQDFQCWALTFLNSVKSNGSAVRQRWLTTLSNLTCPCLLFIRSCSRHQTRKWYCTPTWKSNVIPSLRLWYCRCPVSRWILTTDGQKRPAMLVREVTVLIFDSSLSAYQTRYVFHVQCAAKKYPLKFFVIFLAVARNFYMIFHVLITHS